MLNSLIPLTALLISVVLLLTGNGLQNTLLPVRASLESFNPLQIGLLGSAYFAGFVLGCLRVTRMIHRVGHIRTFAALVAAASAIPLVHALWIAPGLWLVLRALTGFCLAGLYVVIESWLNECATNSTRGTILSTYTTLNFGAITLGQLLLTTHPPELFALFALTSVLLSVAAIPVALSTSVAPAPIAEVRLRPLRLLRTSPVGAAGCVTVGLANGAFWSLAPVFALASGLQESGIALFMSATVIGAALAQWPFGRISDRTDRRLIILVCCLLGALAGLGVVLSSLWSPPLLALAGFFYGACSFPLYALAVAHVNDLIEPDQFVETSGGLIFMNGLGAVAGPLLASLCMAVAGPPALFGFSALVLALMAAFTVTRLKRNTIPAEQHSGDFVRTTLTTPVLAEIDPRNEPAPPATDEAA
ncbi:MAG: MFS transporter [Pseudomonadota bacterium]|nr:MFS transporter [Pseudomonadota bacterium]